MMLGKGLKLQVAFFIEDPVQWSKIERKEERAILVNDVSHILITVFFEGEFKKKILYRPFSKHKPHMVFEKNISSKHNLYFNF